MNKFKHFPSSTREWNNSVYYFNKNAIYNIPIACNIAFKLIKSYFDLYNDKLERKIRKRRIKFRLKRLSLNKIILGNAEFKHTINKLIVTIYVFNRQKLNYSLTLKKRYFRVFKFFIKKLNNKFNKISQKSFYKLFKTFTKISYKYSISKTYYKYNTIFYKKFLKKRFKKLKRYIYFKQLIYLNNSKSNYTLLDKLKIYLENIFNKNVEINIINVKRFYLNNDILVNTITTKITKNRRKLARFLKTFPKQVKINSILSPINNMNSLNNFLFKNLNYRYTSGFRIEARGRLTRRYTASRSKFIFKYKGSLSDLNSSYNGLSSVILKGNLKSNIQYKKLGSKTRIGSFGIKGWLSGN